MYSAYVLLNRLYEPTWQTAATITLDELNPFRSMPSIDSFYNMYARTITNGIITQVTSIGRDPMMNYFASNFNSSMSDGDCNGIAKIDIPPTDGRIFEPVCAYLPFWDTYGPAVTQSNDGTWRQEFGIYAIPEIDRAIYEAAFHVPGSDDAFSDPTDGAIGARPTNRIWSVTHPNVPTNAFVFRTYLDRIIFYTWSDYTAGSMRDWIITNPVITNANGTARTASEIAETCSNADETLAQSFMRNLDTIYWTSAYQALPAFPDPQRQYYLRDDVRYGMSDDDAGRYSRSAHGLAVEGQSFNSGGTITALPFSLSPSDPVGNIGAVSWQTYRFTRPSSANDPNFGILRPIVVPITGAEAVPLINGVEHVELVSC
jgi:hypothetical protein